MKKLIVLLSSCLFTLFLSAQHVSDIGGGLQGTSANAITKYNGEIYVGGAFSQLNDVLRLENDNWQPLGSGISSSLVSFVKNLYVFNNKLYVCGRFDSAGNYATQDLGVWNGTNWEDPQGGIENATTFHQFNNELYVGVSEFLFNGGWTKPFWKLSGNGWTNLDDSFFVEPPQVGPNSQPSGITAITLFDGKLVLAGSFKKINDKDISNIAIWDGTDWQALGTGVNGAVNTVYVFKGELYVGGNFDSAGGQSTKFLAKWNGTNWSDLATNIDGEVYALSSYNNNLFIGGQFVIPNRGLLRFNGSSISAPFEPNNAVRGFFNEGASIIAIGDFSTVDGSPNARSLIIRYSDFSQSVHQTKQNKLKVFPNPAKQSVIIDSGNFTKGTLFAEIYNSIGKRVIAVELQAQQKKEINIEALAAGTYHLVIKQNGNYNSETFVKQ